MAEARAADIVLVLGKRGIAMASAERELILACRDIDKLEAWLDVVLSVSQIGELFGACR